MNQLRKTHPMVLIAAIALTIFSLIGSAAITGLIPSAPTSAMRNSTIPMNQIENANISAAGELPHMHMMHAADAGSDHADEPFAACRQTAPIVHRLGFNEHICVSS